jgi:MFS family permease
MTEFFVQDQSIPPDEAGPTALHLIEIGDKNGDAKLNRDELASLAGDYPAARTFLDAQNKRIQARGGLALDNAYVAPVMTFGQICETIVLAFLPLVLTHLGFRLTIALGILAWSVRYFVFALGEPTALVLASQTLHGFGYGFFFVAIYIYGDAIAPKDIKASVQSLLVFVTIGVGMLVSSLVAGPIADALQQDYHKIFLVPAILCLVCCGAFYAGFRPKAAVNAPPSSQK